MEMTPLYWLILGVVLLFVELATPGFIAMFFGLSALTIALISWLIPLNQVLAWLLFALLSIVYILLLRKLLKKVFLGDKEDSERLEDSFIGKYAKVAEAITPDNPGNVESSGCLWAAESRDSMGPGERVKIVDKKNLTLFVSKEKSA